jgi:hypothetical protein
MPSTKSLKQDNNRVKRRKKVKKSIQRQTSYPLLKKRKTICLWELNLLIGFLAAPEGWPSWAALS